MMRAFRQGEDNMEETLNTARDAAASVMGIGYTFLDSDLTPTYWSFAKVRKEARRIGACLQAYGMTKGDRLALVLNSPEEFVLSFLGAISAGIMPVPMYPPLALGRMENYIERAAGILRVSGAKALLTTRDLIPVLNLVLSRTPNLTMMIDVETLRQTATDLSINEPATHPDEPCFLQFTSGSTSAPRGVIVTHRNLIANSKAIIDTLELKSHRDRAISWLPLYHDMGLIGFVITSLVGQLPVVFIPTIAFVKHPGVWMATVDKYRGTVTFGPNFAFDLATKRAPKNSCTMDLSCLRVLGCGAEPINPKTMEKFLAAFSPVGLKSNSIMPCYGMAEATLAIAFDHLHRPVRKLVIDRHTYETQNIALPLSPDTPTETKLKFELVSCGRTFKNHELKIVNEQGEPLPEGRVGEIIFKGPSVTPGYFENDEASSQLIKGGWLHTGDLGFIMDGDLFISGRQKDLVIINGRNYPPQAIEWVVEEIAGIRKGSVVAFSIDGASTEKLVIIAETIMPDNEELASTISDQVRSALGLAVTKVVLVRRGTIPKTSSGKLQRRQAKALFEGGMLGNSDVRSTIEAVESPALV
jgi:fatty-acyl-CoA synthase